MKAFIYLSLEMEFGTLEAKRTIWFAVRQLYLSICVCDFKKKE